MGPAMTWDDVTEAVEMHRIGLLPYRAAAWALMRFRKQEEIPLTFDDVKKHIGGSRGAVYKVIAELRQYSESPISRVSEIETLRNKDRLVSDSETTPYRELVLESTGTGTHAGEDAPEPFETPESGPVGGMPDPQGEDSAAAHRLALKFQRYGSTGGRRPMGYDEVARLLCGPYAAEWVDAAMTCHLQIWGNRPGYGAIATKLQEWQAAGRIDDTFAAALNPTPRPSSPVRATGTGGRPNPADLLPETW